MYRKVLLLSGISILAILIEHADTFGIDALYFWLPRYQTLLPANYNPLSTPQYIILILFKQGFIFGVPAFLFVSGFFAGYAINLEKTRWKIITTRILALVVPYLFWTDINIILDAGTGNISTTWQYLARLFFGVGGFWFIPVLIVFYLISPWLIRLSKINSKSLLIFSGILQIVFITLKYTIFLSLKSTNPLINFIINDQNNNFLMNWIFYFPFGIVYYMHQHDLKIWMLTHRKSIELICAFSFLIAMTISLWKNIYLQPTDNWITGFVDFLSHLYSVFIIIVFLILGEIKGILYNQIIKLSPQVYGIYLTHYFFQSYFSRAIYHLIPALLRFQILFFILNIVIGLGGSLLLMRLMRKSRLKSHYALVFG